MAASRVLQVRGRAHPVAGRHRAALPRARHGRRRVHRGLRDRHRAPAQLGGRDRRRRGPEQRRPHPVRLVDPWREPRRCAACTSWSNSTGARFKFHPSLQGFEPNDRRFYPLYEAIAEHGVPALFHTGQTGIGAAAGGHGIKLRYPTRCCSTTSPPTSRTDHHRRTRQSPGRTRRSPSPPTRATSTSTCPAGRRSTSAAAGAGRQLDAAAQGAVRLDFPVIQPDRWFADFAKLEIKDDVKPLIYKENALRALRLRD